MKMVSRRTILLTAATATVGGCLGGSENDKGSTLGWVVVSNHHEDSHVVEFKIDWEGETVLEETYELPARDPDSDVVQSEIVDWSWPDEPGQFTVSARSSGDEWSTVDPADSEYPDCFTVYVLVDEFSGAVRLATLKEEHLCSEEEIERLKERAESDNRTDQ